MFALGSEKGSDEDLWRVLVAVEFKMGLESGARCFAIDTTADMRYGAGEMAVAE
jgi:hypothetical protein